MLGIELTPEHPPRKLAEWAAVAEDASVDTVFASHHYNNRDEFVALSAMVETTETVRLGPGIVNPYETHPVALASRAATLDELSGGRGVFGVGPGDRSTLANLGYERDRPLRRVLETMQVARRLWAGERVDHDGTFEAVDAGLNYEARDLPVYVGAQGPDMLRMAAKYADGVLANGSHPEDVAWAADRVAEGRAQRPADRGEVDVLAYASVSVAESSDAAREAARPPVAFIAGGAPEPVLSRHGLDRDRAATIGESIADGAFTDAFERVSEEMIDAFCAAGTPATVEERLTALLEHADGLVLGSPLGPDPATAIAMAARSARSASA